MISESYREKLNGWRRSFLLAGIAGAALSAFGFFLDARTFAASYLTAYLFWLGISLGSFPVIMLHHLTDGGWGYPIRRVLEIAVKLLPWLALGFVPILLNLEVLYPWADPDVMAHDHVIREKELYLNKPFFLGRAAFYFLIWILLGLAFYHGSLAYDRTDERSIETRLQALSGLGLVLYGLTVTFASIDWGMSLEPHWFSTIYGFMFMVGQTVAAFAFTIPAAFCLSKEEGFSKIVTPSRSHDLGNLLLAFVMIWAYISLSQFIIIWSGNVSELTPWYIRRFHGGWQSLSVFITLFHFVIPFFLLLGRALKRNLSALAKIAGLLIFMRWVDLIWVIKPVFVEALSLHWLDITCFAALGGLWLALFCSYLGKTPLILAHDSLLRDTAERKSS